eukprot:TRINITY_DN109854_c0_g1_i1.p1 TRINITY_DN109854_c0_g1~~TRINITY_DN109854_c0_g1_i1.p1  ORF type:complete len:312 (-),score=46.89 TRINITY_DN109854_c0_g1_i1:273-1208(-)
MTSIDKDSYTINSVGKQCQSQRRSAHIVQISQVPREAREKVFIGLEAVRPARMGRHSPEADTINLPSTLDTNMCAIPNFGFGGRSDFVAVKYDPDSIPSNDAMDIIPDSQPFKYKRDGTIVIGTCPRGKLKDAFLMKNHASAFFARDSPGPAAVGGDCGPKFEATKPRMAPARPFGIKTYLKWDGQGDNPPEVGPGTFERKDSSFGPQALSKRRNQSTYAFGKAAKFPKDRAQGDIISQYDAARSCFGKQVLNRNRSAPSIGFSADSRDTRSKTKCCITKLDEGPKANFVKPVFRMPALPAEKAVMRSGFG